MPDARCGSDASSAVVPQTAWEAWSLPLLPISQPKLTRGCSRRLRLEGTAYRVHRTRLLAMGNNEAARAAKLSSLLVKLTWERVSAEEAGSLDLAAAVGAPLIF